MESRIRRARRSPSYSNRSSEYDYSLSVTPEREPPKPLANGDKKEKKGSKKQEGELPGESLGPLGSVSQHVLDLIVFIQRAERERS